MNELGFVVLYFCLFKIQLVCLLYTSPSVLLIFPAAPSSRPYSCDSVGQSFCDCCTFYQVSFLWYGYRYCFCPLLWYFSFSPGLPEQFVYLLRHPFSLCLNHFTYYPICSWAFVQTPVGLHFFNLSRPTFQYTFKIPVHFKYVLKFQYAVFYPQSWLSWESF